MKIHFVNTDLSYKPDYIKYEQENKTAYYNDGTNQNIPRGYPYGSETFT